jgi:hypothetical protein
MSVLIILVVLAMIALIIVSAINRAQEQAQLRRIQQRKLRVQAQALLDMVTVLEQTIPNRLIIKHINDEAIVLLNRVLALETRARLHIQNSIYTAQIHSDDLINGKVILSPSYQKDNDALINQTQLQITDAGKVLRHLCAQGTITEAELETFLNELIWAFLMISVMSFVAQGHKFMSQENILLAHNFYNKAQQLLIQSEHKNPNRLRMIKELGEIISGSRKKLSWDLMPEQATFA